ncbi:sulfatase-like hydrolase/transferase [Mucilaginibacter sp. AW1-3]
MAKKPSPNYVVILMDDMGYKDIGCFGGTISTPNIDALAGEGIKFTNFYAGGNVCSPSRAALLTGLYPNRSGITKVLFAKDKVGLSHTHQTIPQCLSTAGYTSAIIGKWHLGHTPDYLPLQYGFSFYYGLPYSNDMLPDHKNTPDLPVYLNDKVVELNPDQTQLTTHYTEQGVNFVNGIKGKPFFLYMAHSMPHVPLAVSDKFKNKSGKGLYSDVIMELDWSVGEIVKALKANNVYHNTIIILASDNGPWLTWGNWAGNSNDFREGKFTSFDGGQRVPFIIKGFGHQADIDQPADLVDVFSTFAELSGIKTIPVTDGTSLLPLIRSRNKDKFGQRVIPFYTGGRLQAVRKGDWKYHTTHKYRAAVTIGHDGVDGKYKDSTIEESLFNIKTNTTENKAVNAEKKKNEMRELFKKIQADTAAHR